MKGASRMKGVSPFHGCGTALATPFDAGGRVDFPALERLVAFQIREGIDFLVPCGSTGESAVLSREEHLAVIECVVRAARRRVPVVAGAGGYHTDSVVETVRAVSGLGVDGILSVTPYYNRPTQEGLVAHFSAVAAASRVPVLLYNVPARTGVNLLPDTVVRLAGVRRIAGIKEASGNIDQISELSVKAPRGFHILSGDDANTIPILALGGVGLISVVSNEAPRAMTRLTRLALQGRFAEARRIQAALFPLMRLNFVETSPAPVKAALAMMGLIEERLRLPLVPIRDENRGKIRKALRDLGLLKAGREPRWT